MAGMQVCRVAWKRSGLPASNLQCGSHARIMANKTRGARLVGGKEFNYWLARLVLGQIAILGVPLAISTFAFPRRALAREVHGHLQMEHNVSVLVRSMVCDPL